MLGMVSITLDEANLVRTVRRMTSLGGLQSFTEEVEKLVEKLVKASTSGLTRQERLDYLRHLFYRFLCEDPVEGSGFDSDVHNALKLLDEKYEGQ